MKAIKTIIKVLVLMLPVIAMTVACESHDADFQEIELQIESTDGGDIDDADINKPDF